jgi:hypothetical protein
MKQAITDKRISYLAEPVEDYRKGIDRTKSLVELLDFLSTWELLAWDALDAARQMTPQDFLEMKKAIKTERSGVYMGDENAKRFMVFVLPEVLFMVSTLAETYHAPWGLAYNRMKEVGKITVKRGRAIIQRATGRQGGARTRGE